MAARAAFDHRAGAIPHGTTIQQPAIHAVRHGRTRMSDTIDAKAMAAEPWTRRKVLGAAASGIALAAAGAMTGPAEAQSKKLTYWGGLIFSDDANKLLTDTINDWGAKNGVATEVVMINQNETTQKVSAASPSAP
jgi:hypothetical protein